MSNHHEEPGIASTTPDEELEAKRKAATETGRAFVDSTSIEAMVDVILKVAPHPGTSISVTVVCSGSVFTGDAISFPYYLELLAQQLDRVGMDFRDGSTGEVTHHQGLSANQRQLSRTLLSGEAPEYDTNMLFLKGAQVVSGSTLLPNGGELLIALEKSAIQGWALGRLTGGK